MTRFNSFCAWLTRHHLTLVAALLHFGAFVVLSIKEAIASPKKQKPSGGYVLTPQSFIPQDAPDNLVPREWIEEAIRRWEQKNDK